MKITHVLSAAMLSTLVFPLAPVLAIPLPGVCDVLGNAPIGADTLVSIQPSSSESGVAEMASFAPPVQAKVNEVGATFSATSLSGNQTVGSITVEVDSSTAQVAFDVISSAAGSDSPAVPTLAAALGGNDAAQQLAKSMQGLRRSNGVIDPVILTNAVSAYNSYLQSTIASSQITQQPISELDNFIKGLPAGQKVAQVVLGKLTEAAR
jgi:hypothetical protein